MSFEPKWMTFADRVFLAAFSAGCAIMGAYVGDWLVRALF